jgi:hypothetical protein
VPNKRPELSGALGREAIYGGDQPAPAKKSATKKKAARSKKAAAKAPAEPERWEDRMERATFHIPKELHQRYKDLATATGGERTKSQLVTQALEEFLTRHNG